MTTQAITGSHKGLIDSLTKAGIIPDNTRRVVIDIPYDNCVMLYYETFADERILDIDFVSHLGPVVINAGDCKHCNGSGKHNDGRASTIADCQFCNGTGKINND